MLTCVIEFVQLFLPDRVSDPRDILANSVGAFVGVVAALIVTWPCGACASAGTRAAGWQGVAYGVATGPHCRGGYGTPPCRPGSMPGWGHDPTHTLMALLVVVIWGLNFLAIDFGLEGGPPLLFLALRFAVVVIPAIFFLKPPDIGWRNILLIGGFLSLGQFSLLYIALQLGMRPARVAAAPVAGGADRDRVGHRAARAPLAAAVDRHHRRDDGAGDRGRRSRAGGTWLPVVILLLGSLSWAIGNVLSRAAKATSSLSPWCGRARGADSRVPAVARVRRPARRVRCARAPVVDRHPEHPVYRGGRVAHRLRHLESPARAVPDVGGRAVHAAGADRGDHRRVDRGQRAADGDRGDRGSGDAGGARDRGGGVQAAGAARLSSACRSRNAIMFIRLPQRTLQKRLDPLRDRSTKSPSQSSASQTRRRRCSPERITSISAIAISTRMRSARGASGAVA